MLNAAAGEKVPKGLFSSFKGILNVHADTAASPLDRVPLFMARSAASARRRPLTLHAKHSFAGRADSNTPPGTAPRRDFQDSLRGVTDLPRCEAAAVTKRAVFY